MADEVSLPQESLRRWRAFSAQPAEDAEPADRVRAWLERLTARMLCTGGRLPRLLVETGLCTVEDIVRCAEAQLEAGTAGDGALLFDVEADLVALEKLATLDVLEKLSAKLASIDWPIDTHAGVHGALAARLLDAGNEAAVEPVLARIAWHGPLLYWLERHGSALSADARARLVEHAERLVAASTLPPVYRVQLFSRLAMLSGRRHWLDRAGEVLASLSAEAIDDASDIVHPRQTLACALARLGAFDEAMATISPVDADTRRRALVWLLPLAPSPDARAALLEELIACADPLDVTWSEVLDAAPEVAERVLSALEAITDESARFGTLARILPQVGEAHARRLCAWMVAQASALDPGSPDWADRWEILLGALNETGCESLLDDDARRRLIDALLLRPGLDVWVEAAPFVPDDRVTAAFERARAGLAAADHYTTRDVWIAVGLTLLPRAPAEQTERWLELGAVQIAGTAIEGDGVDRFAAWTPAQQRAIVLRRLAHHQHEFLPRWLLQPMLVNLSWELPPRLWPSWEAWIDADTRTRHLARAREPVVFPAADPSERAEARRTLDALTTGTAWPTFEQVTAAFTALGRCAGEAAVTAAAASLVNMLRRSFG